MTDRLYIILALLFLVAAVVLALCLVRLRKREKGVVRALDEMKARVFSDIAEDYLQVADVSVPVEYTANWKSGDIVSLVSMACRSCEPLAAEKGISLVYDMQDVVKMYYIPLYTQRIVQELVTNAIRFSHPGGEVLISTRLKDAMMQIFVSDQGIGMTAEEKASIFEPFYQAAGPGPSGIGIGLPMVKMGARDIHLVSDSVVVDLFPRFHRLLDEMGKAADKSLFGRRKLLFTVRRKDQHRAVLDRYIDDEG